ncbi:unnamed protein product [Ixodes persulcatus]
MFVRCAVWQEFFIWLQVLVPSGRGVLKKKEEAKEQSASDWPYTDRWVTVRTCGELYRDWRHWKPGYQNAPPQGIEVPVCYLHTGLDRAWDAGRPTVLLLHGAPGSYRDFTDLVPFLDRVGATVVSPTWPDLKLSYRVGTFWHSAEEKTHLLADFLRAINISKIDLVVAHSSAIYPSLNMMTRPGMPTVGGLALLAPAGHQLVRWVSSPPHFLLAGALYAQAKLKTWRRLLHRLVVKCACVVLSRGKASERKSDDACPIDAFVFSSPSRSCATPDRTASECIPLKCLSGVHESRISLKMVSTFPTELRRFWYEPLTTCAQEGSKKVLLFKKGGHYLFRRHPEVINSAILEWLHRVCPPGK